MPNNFFVALDHFGLGEMNIFDHPRIEVGSAQSSHRLKEYVSAITQYAVATIHLPNETLVLTSFEYSGPSHCHSRASRTNVREALVSVERARSVALGSIQRQQLDRMISSALRPRDGEWHTFHIEIRGEKPDRVSILLDQSASVEKVASYFELIWPILRRDCVQEYFATEDDASIPECCDILDHIPVATLILDARCESCWANRTGAEILDNGIVLRKGNGAVYAAHDNESHKFRTAGWECSQSDTDRERTILLTLPDGVQRVPVTLSKHQHNGKPTRYVLVTFPVPPSSKRVERVARKMGLSTAEAQVAALLQSGLSNREAATVSGLKPQTFNTYAKRVLGKLNVKCRSEMAQMLTWQASGRGPS